MSETVYYYCSNTVFSSIICNKTIWLSDMTCSNDASEIVDFFKSISLGFDKRIADIQPVLEEYYKADSTEYIKKIKQRHNQYFRSRIPFLYCLAICFSKRRDNLSQWIAYGHEGQGISIGFDRRILESITLEHRLIRLKDVSYEEKERDAVISAFIGELIDAIKRRIIERHGSRSVLETRYIDGFINEFYVNKNIFSQAPFYKNRDFSMEAETRLAYERLIFQNQLSDIKESSLLNSFSVRACDNKLVPYIPLSIQNLRGVIKEVLIGPCNNTRVEAIRLFITKNGYSDVLVSKSRVTYQIK